ncbi:tetratricopeptide repeat protein 14-like [Uloborus diversus]|uniref:tetratricopeptide repeat protein 14-like n=1 Tax=Uloborus diversus TaxID=327109 RepID=UPI00240A5F9A|nr:tetratricopeptide repeat protein 14-like [Uloborus diversus]
MDQDLWMRALLEHGQLLLQTILSDVPEIESEHITEKVRICRFIKKKLHLLFKTEDSFETKEKPEPQIPTLPIEIFRNISELQRRDLFFSSLDQGSILLLQVINDTLPSDFKLLVLAKHDGCMKLDDLSLVMYLPKYPAEMKFAGGELHSGDLVRAAVWSCDPKKRQLFVTLDSSTVDEVQLGKISEEELPIYTRNLTVGSSYTEYLGLTPAFHDREWENELYTVLNLKKNRMYSFFEEWDGKTYPQNEYASELKKKRDLYLSNVHYEKACDQFDKKNNSEAFLYLNKALCIYPENVNALVSRSKLYSISKMLEKAVEDVESALKIDSTFFAAREHMSTLLVQMAKVHIDNSDYHKAQESLTHSLTYYKENKEAAEMLQTVYVALSASLPSTPSNSSIISPGPKSLHSISSSSESSCSKKANSKSLFDVSLPSTSGSLPLRMKSHHHSRKKRKHHHRHRHRRSPSRSKSPNERR